MSSNRPNKRSSSSKDYAHDDDFEDTKPPAKSSKKKAKTKKSNDVKDSINSTPLPLDALLVVMEFLHPRDLLNTASTCKW